jgi:hypothetical protein
MSFIYDDEDILFSGNGGFEFFQLTIVIYTVSHAFGDATLCLFHPVTRRQTGDNEDVLGADWVALVFRDLVDELNHTAGFAGLRVADDHLNDDAQVVEEGVDIDGDAGLVFV